MLSFSSDLLRADERHHQRQEPVVPHQEPEENRREVHALSLSGAGHVKATTGDWIQILGMPDPNLFHSRSHFASAPRGDVA